MSVTANSFLNIAALKPQGAPPENLPRGETAGKEQDTHDYREDE